MTLAEELRTLARNLKMNTSQRATHSLADALMGRADAAEALEREHDAWYRVAKGLREELHRRDSVQNSILSDVGARDTQRPPETAEGHTEARFNNGGPVPLVWTDHAGLTRMCRADNPVVTALEDAPPSAAKTVAEVLEELRERLTAAQYSLLEMASSCPETFRNERGRIKGKASGVALALDYLREYQR